MDVYHIYVQLGQLAHGAVDGVGDIVELQIEKDLVAAGFDLPHDGRAAAVKNFHTDLDERLFIREPVKKI